MRQYYKGTTDMLMLKLIHWFIHFRARFCWGRGWEKQP